MNSKVKIYSIILAVIYIITVSLSLSTFIDSFKAGIRQGHNEKTTSAKTLHVNISPKTGIYTFPEQIINTVSSESVRVESDNYKIRMDSSNIQMPTYLVVFEIILMALALLFLIALIYLPFLFFSAVKQSTKGYILDKKVIRKIEYMGYITIFIYLADTLSYLLDYLKSTNVVGFEKYNIVFNLPDSGLIFLGIVTLLMAEILKISSKLKEDQDLTI